jgi:hypothetical protein
MHLLDSLSMRNSYQFTPKSVPLFTGPTRPATPGTAKCPEPLRTPEVLPHTP